jgi:hypothetical protein
MRRYLIIFLLLLLPFQFSWAAVASYCQHETESSTQHIGHHEADAGSKQDQTPEKKTERRRRRRLQFLPFFLQQAAESARDLGARRR